MDTSSDRIESASDFASNPSGVQRRWDVELTAAKDWFRTFREKGKKVVQRFLDEETTQSGAESHLNLFHSNVTTQRALLYGKVPRVDVDRRFADSDDDAARVGSEMLERIVNTDIESDDDNYALAVSYALEDWTLPGLGQCRVRYEMEEEEVPGKPAMMNDMGQEMAPAVPTQMVKTSEEAEVDYVNWEDFLYSPCRTWSEVRWVAFRAEMTRDECIKRFGDDLGKKIPMRSKMPDTDKAQGSREDAWMRAEIYEIWDKETKMVRWFSHGMDVILDEKEDTLQLEGFFPCPRPLMANTTTSKHIPKADFRIAEDLYNEIDELTTRIRLLESSVRVTGGYDANCSEISQMVSNKAENKLFPIRNFAAWAEKGGVAGAIAWFPLEPIVKAIEVLTAKRQEKISLLFQVTGMSDIMRGQGIQPATATEQKIKAGFTSTRIQVKQDELARFATDIQKLRCEIIAKHFDPQTIITQSNIMRTKDAPLAQQGVAFIKSGTREYRIQVRPESISLPDAAALKQEGVEFLGAFSQFMSSTQGMNPAATPFVLEIFKWAMSRFRGASQMESVVDRAIDAFNKAAAAPKPPPPPDPKVVALQMKAQMDQQKGQQDMAMNQQKMQMEAMMAQREAQMKQAESQQQMRQNAVEGQQDLELQRELAQLEIEKKRMEIMLDMRKMQAEIEKMNIQADLAREQAAEARAGDDAEEAED